MFPISVDPRAKKKITSRQPPWLNSRSEAPVWRSWMTAALATPARRRPERNFMLTAWTERTPGGSKRADLDSDQRARQGPGLGYEMVHIYGSGEDAGGSLTEDDLDS